MNTIKYNLVIVLLFISAIIFAQEKERAITLNGNIGLFYDTYNYSEQNYPTFRPRYLDNELRLNINATLQIGEYLSIPFGISISNQKTLYNLPELPEENLIDFIQNPRNNISINPEYKWIKGYLGTQTPSYSELTTGDTPIFGIGIELNPEKFIFSANYGLSQRAIESDLFLNIIGAYKQEILATRIGYGKIEGTKITLNFVKVKDDINSVINTPLYDTPIEGLTTSSLIELKIKEKLLFKTETAASIFTTNLNNSFSINNPTIESLNNIITINASSKGDISHVSSLDYISKKITVGGEIRYIGSGFVPVGYRNIEKDVLDYKIKSSFKLFKDKTSINGMFGIRRNNVKNTNLQSTKRVISNINVFSQVSETFSINANYSNFGFNNNEINNLIRIEMINNSFSLSPSYKFKSEKINHQINVNGSLNIFDQFDAISNSFVATKSKNLSLNYNLMFQEIPLNINFISLFFNNEMPLSTIKMSNYGTTVSYKFFDKKLSPSLGLNLSNITRDNFTTDHRFSIRFKAKYKITKKLQFNLSYRLNNYKYGSSRPNAITNEQRMQFAFLQKF
ncbi:hypothetical protein Lupro_05790 [Lutibacter profundi]|uniref:Outer membrane protein beta-barrel domain-containing protein n=1 Tax=Lutibacter profundi TaxID=1622118 RepID=A0A120IE72_9FLAO|nr:hypothetical protein [Lutibacter profundi]AMC10781.1 hypothetical protein Lupro_05790 [Lutibacter profundi]